MPVEEANNDADNFKEEAVDNGNQGMNEEIEEVDADNF
jgi:hypothetical protein